MPAALLGELQMAAIVAKVMKGEVCVDLGMLESKIHGDGVNEVIIKLDRCENFVRERAPKNIVCNATTLRAANAIAHNNQIDEEACKCMLAKWLALPSSTHFVKTGVKEAKIVSTTGQNEEFCSVHAIARSTDVFDKGQMIANEPKKVIAQSTSLWSECRK